MAPGEASARVRRRRLALGALTALFATALLGALAPLTAADAAAASTPAVTCDEMVDAATLAELDAAGMVLTPDSTTTLFPADAAHQCWWYHPDSPRVMFFGVGWMAADDAVVDAEVARLLAIPSFYLDGDTVRSDGRTTDSMVEFVDGSWVFQARSSHWFFAVQPTDPADPFAQESRSELDARMDGILAGLQQNVLAVVAPDAPAAPPPPDESFTATTPSTLSGLPTVGDVTVSALSVGGAVAGAIVLAALVGLPGRLVESALAARYDEWSTVVRPWTMRAARVHDILARAPRALVLGGGLVAASLLAALVEPDLGVNAGSLRLVLSLLAGFAVESLLGLALIALLLRRRGRPAHIVLRPGSLVIVLVTALASRVAGFEPGFVFGLVLALVFAASAEEDEATASIAEGAWLLVAGLTAWILYSGAVGLGWADAGVVGLFATEGLAGLAVGCLAALPLVMLPLPGLPGRAIWRRRRMLWAGAQVVAAAVFVFVVLPFPLSWEQVDAPFATWILAFAVYAGVAVALWAVLTFTPAAWFPPPGEREVERRAATG